MPSIDHKGQQDCLVPRERFAAGKEGLEGGLGQVSETAVICRRFCGLEIPEFCLGRYWRTLEFRLPPTKGTYVFLEDKKNILAASLNSLLRKAIHAISISRPLEKMRTLKYTCDFVYVTNLFNVLFVHLEIKYSYLPMFWQ